jgi:hypothetical protein
MALGMGTIAVGFLLLIRYKRPEEKESGETDENDRENSPEAPPHLPAEKKAQLLEG